MEENNTTLLDFISSTVADQLKRLNTEVNKEVAEIDLEKIKNELSNKISSLFNVQEKPKE